MVVGSDSAWPSWRYLLWLQPHIPQGVKTREESSRRCSGVGDCPLMDVSQSQAGSEIGQQCP